jgi:hypothetical protein
MASMALLGIGFPITVSFLSEAVLWEQESVIQTELEGVFIIKMQKSPEIMA